MRSVAASDGNPAEVTHLSLGGGRHVRVLGLADHVLDVADRPRWDLRERLCAVVGEVAVHFPRLPEVVGALDEHGGRTERFEAHDEMREVELGLEVDLDGDFLAPVLGLPPLVLPVVAEVGDDVLDAVAHGVEPGNVRVLRVAHEALERLLEMRHDAVTLLPVQPARRRREQPVLAPDQQVAGCWVTTALVARRLPAPLAIGD